MSKTSKRAISILVIAVFMMSIFAVIPVNAAVIAIVAPLEDAPYDFGDTIKVTGTGVTSGALVNLYWNYVTLAGQMNSTLGDPAGDFEVWLKVPEATVGDNYLWVKDVGNNNVDSRRIQVISLVKLSPSSGLPGDDIDVKGYGFDPEKKIDIVMEEDTVDPEVIGTGAIGKMTFSGTLTNLPVEPDSLTITATVGGSPVTITDLLSDGNLADLLVSPTVTGAIDYVTGIWTLTFTGTPPDVDLPITAEYTWAGFTIQALDTFETDELGSFTKEFVVPSLLYGDYFITANTTLGTPIQGLFTVGASISATPEEGPTGTKVTVEGRGWTEGKIMSFTTDLELTKVVDPDDVEVDSRGEFSVDVVIPGGVTEGECDITATESDTGAFSSVDFDVTGLPEVVVTPTYGTPGSTITVTGSNFTQIAGTEVVIKLLKKGLTTVVADLVIAETKSDGTFEDTFMSPAVEFETYDVEAKDEYLVAEDDPFKVGLIALIINPVYGEAGTKVSITGIGFAYGDYNVTFGIKLYENYGSGVSIGEAISDTFYVPNVPTGPYDIIISDEDGNEMPVEFRVTAVTEVTLDPASAPNKYNMTIEGCNFADKDLEDVEFVLYNATDEWDMDVRHGLPLEEGTPVDTDDDGNFTGWWKVLDEDTLSLGDYTINVTGYDDFFVQVPFSVVEARVSVAPRKPLFDRGDSIQFNVMNDFDFDESYMKIWDPDENLVWKTQTFTSWVKAGDLYSVPYYMQTSGMNPMELSQDAPLGTWTYVFYETGTTQLTNGTFEVGPSAESLLTDQIAALSEELGVDIDTLQTYIDAKIIDLDDTVTNMAEDIATAVSSMEDDISGLSDDLDDAVTGMQDDIDDMGTKMDSIETMVDDITGTSTAAQEAANQAANSADAALEAAEANKQQTGGLTTLVYGAIAASLIAALAAIVSLMQISRRIAG